MVASEGQHFGLGQAVVHLLECDSMKDRVEAKAGAREGQSARLD